MAIKTPCKSILVTHLPNVRYLTGFTGSSGCALVTPRRKVFFTDSRYRLQALREVKTFETVITNGPPITGACHYIVSKRVRTGPLGYEGAHLSVLELGLLRRGLKGAGIKLSDVSGCIEDERLVKSAREISRVRKAARMADAAYERLRRAKVIGRSEKQVAWLLEKVMREAGSQKLPFDIIVASGPRSAMPHGVASDRIIRADELVVVDLGAQVDGYCSDATRTFATGELSVRLREIYETVKQAQALAVAAVRPGGSCADLDAVARDHIDAAGYGEAFGHSLGHGVGLEAHERPVLSSRSKESLHKGMIVTVEPGIYLNRTGGVRIEDTVLVGSRGPVPLTGFTRDLVVLR